MKAIVYDGIQKVECRNVADPGIEKEDDVVVKVTSTAICGSDLHLVHGLVKGMYDGYILGHETMGIVEEAGKGVKNLKKGDRVVIPFPVACGHCEFCSRGEYSQCDNSNDYGEAGGLLGYSKSHGNYAGGQAEYIRVPYANVGPKKVPEGLTDEQVLFVTDVLPTSYWGTEIANVKAGDTVVVLGCGPIGLTAISASKTFGAVKVIACDLIDEKLEVAKKMGADAVLNSAKCDLPAEVRTLTGGVGVDAAIDITGAEPALNSALKCLRAAGRLVCVGLPTKPITFHDMTDDLVYREVQLTGVSGRKIWETWEDFAKVMKGPYFKLDQVIGGRFPMKDFEAALAQIHSGVPGKMILYP